MSLFNELKRRNVFKVTIAYIVMAWLVMQVADVILNNITAPEWVFHVLLLFLVIGLPFTVFFAWAFEMTPEGLKREHEVDRSQSITTQTGRTLDFLIIGVMVVALAYFVYDKFVLDPSRDAELVRATTQAVTEQVITEQEESAVSDNSIAVLPFVNMSDDASNEYFSDGLSEELLNLLAKIPELRVAARTSSFFYKDKLDTITLAEVAQQLGVNHLLEGSVRKAGNRVRITVQLIKADDGFHLWSETYDRTLDDIFVTQDEIAAAVVDALKVTLLGAMPGQRVTDPEVYALYLQGRHFANLKSQDNLEKAQSVFEQALTIDPEYAPAWVAINIVYGEQNKYGFRSPEQAFTLSMAATERALAIDSNLAEAWSSLAYLKRARSDWAGAKTAIDKALELEPNNSLVIGSAATLASALGQLDKSIELFEQNTRLDPLSLSTLRALALRYGSAGRHDEALETFNRILAFKPDFPGIHPNLATTYMLKGDAETALIEINKDPSWHWSAFVKARILLALGKEAEAHEVIRQLLEGPANLKPLTMAEMYAWAGENDLAFEWFEKARLQNSTSFAAFLISPFHRNLVSDPRYALFVEKIGLLEAWQAMPPEYGGPAIPPS